MESLAVAFANTLGKYVAKEVVVFIISMIPILELRGGLIVASLLQVPIMTAIPFCIIGNIIPIPFILLFIKQVFKWLSGESLRSWRAVPWVRATASRNMSSGDWCFSWVFLFRVRGRGQGH